MSKIKDTLDTMRYVVPSKATGLIVGVKVFGLISLVGLGTAAAQEAGAIPPIIPTAPHADPWVLLASGLLSALAMLGGQFISAWREASKLRGADLERIRGERDAAKADAAEARERALRAEVRLEIRDRDPRNRNDD